MNLEPVLILLGSFLSLLMMVNAFFTRKTLEKITDVELKLAVLIANHDATEERSRKNEKDIMLLRERYHDTINNVVSVSTYNKMEIETLKITVESLAQKSI